MKEDEVRTQLEEVLEEPLGETAWKELIRSEAVNELITEKLSWEDFRHLAEEKLQQQREYYREARRGREPRLGDREEDGEAAQSRREETLTSSEQAQADASERFELRAAERLRAEVFEEYLATAAAAIPNVKKFRERVIGNELISAEQALELVRSPAAQALPLALFKKWEIPLLGHEAKLKNYEFSVSGDRLKRHRATIFIDPPGETRELWSPVPKDQRAVMFEFINEYNSSDRFAVWGNSVLGDLHELSGALAERFSWQRAQATWFVLTGQIPAAPPLHINYSLKRDEHFRRGVVTLTVDPWVSVESVGKFFKSLQDRILGKDNRLVETKNLNLLRFVTERTNTAELTRSERRKLGSKLLKAWDQENPHWAYGKYEKPTVIFWRDYSDTLQRVVDPAYRLPRQLRSGQNPR